MGNELHNIPSRITFLLVGYLQSNINTSEQQELDNWVSASQANRRIFEQCMEATSCPHIKNEIDIEAETRESKELGGMTISRIADLLIKYMNKSISKDESRELYQWVDLSTDNKALLNAMPQTANIGLIYHWVVEQIWQGNSRSEWN